MRRGYGTVTTLKRSPIQVSSRWFTTTSWKQLPCSGLRRLPCPSVTPGPTEQAVQPHTSAAGIAAVRISRLETDSPPPRLSLQVGRRPTRPTSVRATGAICSAPPLPPSASAMCILTVYTTGCRNSEILPLMRRKRRPMTAKPPWILSSCCPTRRSLSARSRPPCRSSAASPRRCPR